MEDNFWSGGGSGDEKKDWWGSTIGALGGVFSASQTNTTNQKIAASNAQATSSVVKFLGILAAGIVVFKMFK